MSPTPYMITTTTTTTSCWFPSSPESHATSVPKLLLHTQGTIYERRGIKLGDRNYNTRHHETYKSNTISPPPLLPSAPPSSLSLTPPKRATFHTECMSNCMQLININLSRILVLACGRSRHNSATAQISRVALWGAGEGGQEELASLFPTAETHRNESILCCSV